MRCLRTRTLVATAALALAADITHAQTPGNSEPDDVKQQVDDAFGRRIGTESIGLYSESLVRGFDLQQAGNYRLDDAYFVRAASPPDTLVTGSQIRVGPNALDMDFPAPSGIVQYRLLPADRNHARLELGFQHLLDGNPRPYLRSHFAYRQEQGRYSLAGGIIGSSSARYMFGNEARYDSIGLVPRVGLGENWQATAFYGYYDQRYQADAGFSPASGRMPKPDRLDYPGQQWSRFDTRNTTYGTILASRPREGHWDISLSAIHSRVRRPRSDFNIFHEVAPDGSAQAMVSVARNRSVLSRSHEARADREWNSAGRLDRVSLLARMRRSDYTSPQVDAYELGEVSLFDPIPQIREPAYVPRPRAHSRIEQQELGLGWQRRWQGGSALNLGIRNVALEEAATSAGGALDARAHRAWLYNASLVVPLSLRVTSFASFVRGIEEAGVAPQRATNAFEVLPPAMARQAELGLKWQAGEQLALIATLFGIEKPEPGFDREGNYRFMGDVAHRGIEVSLAGELRPGLALLAGATWMRARLDGPAVEQGSLGERPIGRAEQLVLASLSYRPRRAPGWSFDADATYTGPKPSDSFNGHRTPGYTLINVGARYGFNWGRVPAAVRLRVYNASDKYAWYADSDGLQAYEPARRIMLSLTLGD